MKTSMDFILHLMDQHHLHVKVTCDQEAPKGQSYIAEMARENKDKHPSIEVIQGKPARNITLAITHLLDEALESFEILHILPSPVSNPYPCILSWFFHRMKMRMDAGDVDPSMSHEDFRKHILQTCDALAHLDSRSVQALDGAIDMCETFACHMMIMTDQLMFLKEEHEMAQQQKSSVKVHTHLN